MLALTTLRQCGFFEEYYGLADEQAVEALLQRLRLARPDYPWYVEHPEYRPDNKLLAAFDQPATPDLYKEVAAWDFSRVWSGDLEADVCTANNVYKYVVAEYARLSMDTLRPTEVVEVWQSEEGPVTLSFDSDGQHFTTELTYYNDWIDGEVFLFLDAVMVQQGFSSSISVVVEAGQNVFFVRATGEEKTRMEQLLGWSFDYQALMVDEDES